MTLAYNTFCAGSRKSIDRVDIIMLSSSVVVALHVFLVLDNDAEMFCDIFQGFGGLLATVASIITIWLGSGPVQTGFSYFVIALVFTFCSLLLFFVLIHLVSSSRFSFPSHLLLLLLIMIIMTCDY